MARKLRVEYEGAIYHVTIRGVERRPIFRTDSDRKRFLLRMGEAVEEYGVRIYLFCLMRNHVHLLVETPRANLGIFMHKLQTAYTVYFNLRYHRVGHLMQGRYGAKVVSGDEYLLRLSRYIHLNPVHVDPWIDKPLPERLAALREYNWSTFRGYAGYDPPFNFITESPILAMVGGAADQWRDAYRHYVEGGLVEPDATFVAEKKDWHWGVGNAHFQAQIRDLHTQLATKVRRPEDVSFRKTESHINPGVVLNLVASHLSVDIKSLKKKKYGDLSQAIAARMLGRYAGMTQRDIGAYLEIGTGVSVSLKLKRLRDVERQDSSLRDRIEVLCSKLDSAIGFANT